MKKLVLALIAMLLFNTITGISPIISAEDFGRLTVFATSVDGQPIGAWVEVFDQVTDIMVRCDGTGSGGVFSADLKPGTYRIEVSSDGTTIEYRDVNVYPNEVTFVSIPTTREVDIYPPIVIIDSPSSGPVDEQSIAVVGHAYDSEGTVSTRGWIVIESSDKKSAREISIKPGGEFFETIGLTVGLNSIKVIVTDNWENVGSATIEVTYGPTYPVPTLVSVIYPNSINLEDWTTITITARNDGTTAEWQTIHVSFPDNPNLDRIENISHDLNGGAEVYPPGTELPAAYGSYTIVTTYPMVEGVHGPWGYGETHVLSVKVKPEKVGTFTFYVKTVNRANDVTRYDPTPGTKDQQDEYVYVCTISVRTLPIEQYFPVLLFDEEEEYFPTDFYHDDENIANNTENYDQTWPLYAYVHTEEFYRPSDAKDYLVIEYWFYYARDDGTTLIKIEDDEVVVGQHNHDWESVFIYFEKTDGQYKPAYVAYFHHQNYEFPPPEPTGDCCSINRWGFFTFDVVDETHPVVHVCRDSHASVEKTYFGYGLSWLYIKKPAFYDFQIPVFEPCDGGKTLGYNDFQIVYVEPDPGWPAEFGTIEAPWERERWSDPLVALLPPYSVIKNSFTMLSLHETGSKLHLHIVDNQSRHVGFNNETSEIEVEIPGAYMVDFSNTSFIIIPSNITDFKVTVDGHYAHEPIETYELLVSTVRDGEVVDEELISSYIAEDEVQKFIVKVEDDGKFIVRAPDFMIGSDFLEKTLYQGESSNFTITILSVYGFDSKVSLTTGPTPIECIFDPEEVTVPPDGNVTSTLKVTVGSNVNPGEHTLTITGTSDSLTHTISLTITVQTPEDKTRLFIFICTVTVLLVVLTVILAARRRRKGQEK